MPSHVRTLVCRRRPIVRYVDLFSHRLTSVLAMDAIGKPFVDRWLSLDGDGKRIEVSRLLVPQILVADICRYSRVTTTRRAAKIITDRAIKLRRLDLHTTPRPDGDRHNGGDEFHPTVFGYPGLVAFTLSALEGSQRRVGSIDTMDRTSRLMRHVKNLCGERQKLVSEAVEKMDRAVQQSTSTSEDRGFPEAASIHPISRGLLVAAPHPSAT